MKFMVICLFLFISITGQAAGDLESAMKAVAIAKPGDTIRVKNGTYHNSEIIFSGRGAADKPIVIMAETPGGVCISGQSFLRLAGTGIEVNGFYFTNGYAPKGAVIEFRHGKEVASYCRVTNSVIESYNPPSRDMENSWVLIYGRHNRFDHNSILGKTNAGVTLAVILDEERNQQNHHRIEYNYFGRRPNLGSNGGETIRVGTSQSSLTSSFTKIENNYFEACDGEVEIVSIKSCDNHVSNNTFYESMGVVALRHGHRNIIEKNLFIGNHKPHTGGVRVINEGHRIANNYFYRLAGDRFFAALAVMNAVPNSLPNRYHQVKDVEITGNTWVDCANVLLGVGKDNERTQAPDNVRITNNIFYNPHSKSVLKNSDPAGGYHFAGNRVVSQGGKFAQKGFAETKMSKPAPPAGTGVEKAVCGASWFQALPLPSKTLSGRVISVQPGQNTLVDAVRQAAAGDLISLAPGEYTIDQPVSISKYLMIKGTGKRQDVVIRYNGQKSKVPMITIEDGGMPHFRFLSFDGQPFEGRGMPQAAIAPAGRMKSSYSAFIEDVSFYNFHESSFSAFRAQKTTYADTLIFKNCLFRDLSGDAIFLAAEKDDAGKYSAEYVEIINCAFFNVLGHAVDLYRGGSDESTTGPAIIVDHCVLEDVNNKERGAGLRLLGVQQVDVRNTLFSNTGRGGASIRLDETSWDRITVTHCNLYQSGRIASFLGKAVTGPVYRFKPDYLSAQEYDFRQGIWSPLRAKATDGKNIGNY